MELDILDITSRLGENYIEGSEDLINSLIKDFLSIASNITNRGIDDEKLYPYVKRAVISEYNARGAEGILSRSEGSISSSYENIVKKLQSDLIIGRLRRLK